MDLFRNVLPSLLQTKVNIFTDGDYSDYSPYIVNKALSYHKDCIYFVNEINRFRSIDKDAHYNYLINTIRPGKRGYKEWFKVKKDKRLDHIKLYFKCSDKKAREALKILTDEQINEIIRKTSIGGVM